MYNNIKKKIEPFVLLEEYSFFLNRDEAVKAAKDNSSYFFVAGTFSLVSGIIQLIISSSLEYPLVWIFDGCLILFFSCLVRFLLNRVASVLLAVWYGLDIFGIVMETYMRSDLPINLFALAALILFMASVRSCQASFYYHRKES